MNYANELAARHLSSRPETENLHVLDAELAKGRFSFIYRNSHQKEIKLRQCFPLFTSRALCNSAIRVLQRAFDADESGLIGYSHAGGLKVVVKIPEEELGLVKTYLLGLGKIESEADAAVYAEGSEWFGIVDGRHIHTALLGLEQSSPYHFQDFKWVVTVIDWQPFRVLKAFSWARNMMQVENIVEVTLYDTIQGLHEIAREKAKLVGDTLENVLKQRGIIKGIADDFCGGSRYSKQTMRTLTGAVLRIKPAALQVLGRIMTEENSSVARKVVERPSSDTLRDEHVFDARAYKNIISTNTIRAATAFLNASAEDQSNALLKLKFGYEENGFKGFQASRLNKETERSCRARRQVQFLREIMCRESWPEELSEIKKNLLFSSRFDSELDQLDQNSDEVLPSLIKEYRERMPLEAGLRLHFYESERARRNQSRNESNNENNQGENRSAYQENQSVHQGNASAARDMPRDNEECHHPMEQCSLERLGITCFNMNLERYSIRRSVEDEKFHLITGDPTQLQLNGTCRAPIDELQADKYIRILKLMVHSHGWVFLYTRAVDYSLWDKAFRANGFEPLEYPWLMIRGAGSVQENTSQIPQSISEMLIGARKKEFFRPEFQPNTTSRYSREVSSRKRKFAMMDNSPEPRLKLRKPNTRAVLRSNQRSCEPIAEFLETFCPPNGNVLDAFAGTLETATACILTGRNCVSLETEKQCFDIALKRLKEIATEHCTDYSSSLNERTEQDSTPPQLNDRATEEREEEEGTEINAKKRLEFGMDTLSDNSFDMSNVSEDEECVEGEDGR